MKSEPNKHSIDTN